MQRSSQIRRRTGLIALAGLATCLAGCAAGPDFVKPAAPKLAHYDRVPLTATVASTDKVAGTAQQVITGGKVSAKWWTRFHSAALDALELQALAHNPTLAAARATLHAAHEDVLAERGDFLPSVSAGVSASREQDPSAALAPVPSNNAFLYSLITPELDIAYTPDVFGLNRRTRESLKAQQQAVRFQALAAWNSLTTNVAVTAIEVASLNAQVAATRKILALGKHRMNVIQLRFKGGAASGLDVANERAQQASLEVGLADLMKQQAQAQHALAALVGTFPGQQKVTLTSLADWQLPASVPLSLPSQLVAHRPDIRQARADLHAASAAIGIAAAERLPQITLSADIGSTALAISKVFTSGTGLWGVAASLTAPLFDGGALKHQERAAKARYVAAANTYRGSVLNAFGNVADTLVAIREDAKALRASATMAKAAQTGLSLATLKHQHGAIGSFQWLAAEQTWQQARLGLIKARAARFTDTAALYQALGGGWWQRHSL